MSTTTQHSGYQYQIGGSLRADDPTYVTRQADTDLYNALKRGDFCYVLSSRQMGKSSLRVRTIQRLQAEGTVCVTLQMTEIGTNVTAEQWYFGVIKSIVEGLNLEETFDLNEWWYKNERLGYVQRFSLFIEQVLLKSISDPLVIFIDEIDTILSLPFEIGDFFAVIRECYNNRADKQDYQRLRFVLIGVVAPSDLIQDKWRTPFNIGQAIDLTGFQLKETQPLADGLTTKTSNPQVALKVVLDWSGGQPLLTQKICKLIHDADTPIPEGQEEEIIGQLVQTKVINNWQTKDDPQHLRTICDRILDNKQRVSQLLEVYEQILKNKEIIAEGSSEQTILRFSGLVIQKEGKLTVYNRIYETVFNEIWVNNTLLALAKPFNNKISSSLALNKLPSKRSQTIDEFFDASKNQNNPIQSVKLILVLLFLLVLEIGFIGIYQVFFNVDKKTTDSVEPLTSFIPNSLHDVKEKPKNVTDWATLLVQELEESIQTSQHIYINPLTLFVLGEPKEPVDVFDSVLADALEKSTLLKPLIPLQLGSMTHITLRKRAQREASNDGMGLMADLLNADSKLNGEVQINEAQVYVEITLTNQNAEVIANASVEFPKSLLTQEIMAQAEAAAGSVKLPISQGDLRVEIATSHGVHDVAFQQGEFLRLLIRTNQPAYVYVFVADVNKHVTWLYPESPDIQPQKIKASELFILPEDGLPYELIVQAPFGPTTLWVITFTKPPKWPLEMDDTWFQIDTLRPQVRKLGLKTAGDYAEAEMVVETIGPPNQENGMRFGLSD